MLNISESTIVKILKYGVYASLAWFFLVAQYTLYPSHTGKILFLFSLIEILSVFYILLISKYPQYRPKLNLMTGAIIVWGGTMILSAVLGADLWISIFSQFKRMTGLFFLAHIFVFFLIITAIFKTWEDWRNFLIANVTVGLVNALLGLYQKIDDQFFIWLAGDVARISGILGNPSFLASYLLFVLFICLFLFLKSENIKWKIFNAISFFIILTAIFFAGTRGTILGVLVGLLIFLLLYTFYSQNKKLKRILICVFVATLISGLFIWINKDAEWMNSVPVIKRAFNITWAEFSASTRKMLWSASWDGFKDRPVFGWGPENFNLIFDKYYNPQILNYKMGESWPTKPHNVFMEHLAGGGIIGFASFIFLYAAAIYVIWRKIKNRQPDDLPLAVFISLFIAHLVQNIVLFDIFYTYYMLAIVFGFVAFLDDKQKQIFSAKPLQRDYINSAVIIALIIAMPLMYINLDTYRAAYDANHFSFNFLDRHSFYKDDFRKSFVKFYLDDKFQTSDKNEKRKILEKINTEMSRVVERHPKNVFDLGYKIQTLTELGLVDAKYLEEAELLIGRAIELSPKRQHLYFLQGRIYVLKKDYGKAIDLFKKTVELNPSSPAAHWYLGMALYLDGQRDLGFKEVYIAYETGYDPENAAQFSLWGLIFAEHGRYKESANLYWHAIRLNPNNVDYYVKLAAIYKEDGEKIKAKWMADEAVKLDPSLKEEAELFKKEVDKMQDNHQ